MSRNPEDDFLFSGTSPDGKFFDYPFGLKSLRLLSFKWNLLTPFFHAKRSWIDVFPLKHLVLRKLLLNERVMESLLRKLKRFQTFPRFSARNRCLLSQYRFDQDSSKLFSLRSKESPWMQFDRKVDWPSLLEVKLDLSEYFVQDCC